MLSEKNKRLADLYWINTEVFDTNKLVENIIDLLIEINREEIDRKNNENIKLRYREEKEVKFDKLGYKII